MNATDLVRSLRDAVLALGIAAVIAPSFAADPVPAAPSADMKAQARALVQLCRADAQRLCSSVEAGGGRKLACLETHRADVTPACRDALPKAEALKAEATKKGVPPK